MILKYSYTCSVCEQIFAAIAYPRSSRKQFIEVRLVISRAQVAPLKPGAVLGLEFQAAVLG